MMYYIIRIVVIIVFALITMSFFKTKYKVTKNNVAKINVKKARPGKAIFRVLICILILAVVFYPYESYFIRFGSPEESAMYSVPNSVSQSITTVEENRTAFMILHKGNNYSYHSSAKHDDGYGFCDYQTEVKFMYQNQYLEQEEFKGLVSLSTIYNKETNTTCYLLHFIGDIISNDFKVFDDENNGFTLLKEIDSKTPFYYFISSDSPEENISIIINDEILLFS